MGIEVIEEAVAFYTATEATATKVLNGGFLIEAPGYWNGPAV